MGRRAGFVSLFGMLFSLTPKLASSRQVRPSHRDRLLDAIAWRGDETVLDVGCGKGLLSAAAAMRVPNGRCIAVDISAAAISATLVNAAAARVADRVEVRTEDARELTLPESSVDVVLAAGCLARIRPRRDKALARIAAVVRPGGYVVVSDDEWVEEFGHFFRSRGFHVSVHLTGARKAWLVARRPRVL